MDTEVHTTGTSHVLEGNYGLWTACMIALQATVSQ